MSKVHPILVVVQDPRDSQMSVGCATTSRRRLARMDTSRRVCSESYKYWKRLPLIRPLSGTLQTSCSMTALMDKLKSVNSS